MRFQFGLVLVSFVMLLSCNKEHRPNPVPSPELSSRRILLKDITIPNLPSPYYHFEYNTDSLVTKADFASGFTTYDVLYGGNKINEMRNNIILNHDTLQYVYDAGKLVLIKFINAVNVLYRRVFFTYEGNQIKEIEWDHKDANTGYLIDRTLSFTFYSDGNVKTITERRPPITGSPESVSVKTFDQYDDKINVDDFSLIHDGFHDHLFLLQGFRLQKNNPKKEKLSVNGADFYTIDYTYTYNTDKTPSRKAGDFLYLGGQYAGQRFQTNSFYSYY
jgi:hypothetical protein